MSAARAMGRIAAVLVALAALVPAIAAAPATGTLLDKPRASPCVEDPTVMRRIHMDLVKHGRDDTVHLGIRDRKTSLAACVDCHANAKDGSVVGSNAHFCQGCHAYAAVKIDCFECHSSHARDTVQSTAAAAGKGGS